MPTNTTMLPLTIRPQSLEHAKLYVLLADAVLLVSASSVQHGHRHLDIVWYPKRNLLVVQEPNVMSATEAL